MFRDYSASSRACRLMLLIAATFGVLVATSLHAQDQDPDQLRLNALVQEGDLLLEEAVMLDPATEELAREGNELAASEKALLAESRAMNQAVKSYNAQLTKISKDVQQHKALCPRESQDKALVASCNSRAAQLREAAREIEEEGRQVQMKQDDLNARIERFNTARATYAPRKREHDEKTLANHKDVQYWLSRVKPFMSSAAFGGFVQKAGNPEVCTAERLGTAPATVSVALQRVQNCLKVVKASSG